MPKLSKGMLIGLLSITILAVAVLASSNFGHNISKSYDVRLSAVQTVGWITASESFTFNITVHNDGTSQDTIDLINSTLPTNWTATLSYRSVTLGGGKKTSIQLTVQSPIDAKLNDQVRVNVTGTSRGDPNEFDKIGTITVIIKPAPYLIKLICIDDIKFGNPGANIIYNITVKNEGTNQDTINLNIFGTPSTWGASLSQTNVPLNPSVSKIVTLTLTIPSDAPANFVAHITVTGVSQGNTSISDSATTTTIVWVPGRYDVDIFCANPTKLVNPGNKTVYYITVINNGSMRDTFNLTLCGDIDSWKAYLSSYNITLNATKSDTVNLTVWAPQNAATGSKSAIMFTATSNGNKTNFDFVLTITTVNTPPIGEAGVNQTVYTNQLVNFNGSGSYDIDGIIVRYDWDFHDGYIGFSVTTGHRYLDDGVFNVTLTVTDDFGLKGIDNVYITVKNVAPIAKAGPNQTVDEGNTVYFTSNGSFDTDGIIVKYDWDFGDGSVHSCENHPSHVYSDNGNFTVTLQITDDDSAVGNDTTVINVRNVSPTAFAGPDQTIEYSDFVFFFGNHSDPGINDSHTYYWDFGDDHNETGRNVAHQYLVKSGLYKVTLKVVDDDGGIGIDYINITVIKETLTLTYIGDTSGQYSDNVTVSAKLGELDLSNGNLSGKLITFIIGSQSVYSITNGNGIATATLNLAQDSTLGYTVNVFFVGDAYYLPSNDSKPFDIQQEDTILTYAGDLREQYSDKANLSAVLLDADSGLIIGDIDRGIDNQKISFTIGTQSTSGITSFNGEAVSNLIIAQDPIGIYTVVTKYLGNNYYNPSSDIDGFDILKEESVLIYTGDLQGVYSDQVIVSASLTDPDGSLAPGDSNPGIDSVIVTFSINGDDTSNITNAYGKVYGTIVLTLPSGTYTVETDFAGTNYYLPSRDSDTFVVKRETIVFIDPNIDINPQLWNWTTVYSDPISIIIKIKDNDGQNLHHQVDSPKVVYLEYFNGTGWALIKLDKLDNATNSDNTLVYAFEVEQWQPMDVPAGTYSIRFRFDGDCWYNPGTQNATLQVLKETPMYTDPNIDINPKTWTWTTVYSDPITITINLTDDGGEYLFHQVDQPKTVSLEYFNGTKWVIITSDTLNHPTNLDNTLDFTFEVEQWQPMDEPAGIYKIRFRFDGDNRYKPAIQNATLVVIKETPIYQDADDGDWKWEIVYSDPVTITIKVIDDDDENLFHQNDQPKTIYLEYYNGSTWVLIKSDKLADTTNLDNTLIYYFQVEQWQSIDEPAGDYTIRFKFDGDTRYNFVIHNGTLQVIKETPVYIDPNTDINPNLWTWTTVYSDQITITINLKDDDGENLYHQQDEPKTIFFEYYNGNNWVLIKSDKLANASNLNDTLTYSFQVEQWQPMDEPAGNNYTIRFRFDGDSYYNSAIQHGTLEVFKETPVFIDPNTDNNPKLWNWTTVYSDPLKITIKLKDNDGENLFHQVDQPKTIYLEYYNNMNWTIIISDTLSNYTNFDDTLEFTFEVEQWHPMDEPAGIYSIRFRFDGDSHYESVVQYGTLEVLKETPVFTDLNSDNNPNFWNWTTVYSDPIVITIHLQDNDKENLFHQVDQPKTVYLEYFGATKWIIITSDKLNHSTNLDNTLEFSFEVEEWQPMDEPAGSYSIRFRFDGDNRYKTVTQYGSLELLKETPVFTDPNADINPKLWYWTTVYSDPITITINLKDDDNEYLYHQNDQPKTIYFEYLHGSTWVVIKYDKLADPMNLDNTLEFTFEVEQWHPMDEPAGNYTIRFRFDGDNRYKKATQNGTLQVLKETTVLSDPSTIFEWTPLKKIITINVTMFDDDNETLFHQGDQPKNVYLEYLNTNSKWVVIVQDNLSSLQNLDSNLSFSFNTTTIPHSAYKYDSKNKTYLCTIRARFNGDNRYKSNFAQGTLTIIDAVAPEITHYYIINDHKVRYGDVRDFFDPSPEIIVTIDGIIVNVSDAKGTNWTVNDDSIINIWTRDDTGNMQLELTFNYNWNGKGCMKVHMSIHTSGTYSNYYFEDPYYYELYLISGKFDLDGCTPSSANIDNDFDDDGLNNDIDPDDDNDGIPDSEDPDDDNDGVSDDGGELIFRVHYLGDLDDDNDGVPDWKDKDTDNDLDDDGIDNENDTDDDGDGIPDVSDADDDNDGLLDEDDLDDDNDGIWDVDESN